MGRSAGGLFVFWQKFILCFTWRTEHFYFWRGIDDDFKTSRNAQQNECFITALLTKKCVGNLLGHIMTKITLYPSFLFAFYKPGSNILYCAERKYLRIKKARAHPFRKSGLFNHQTGGWLHANPQRCLH